MPAQQTNVTDTIVTHPYQHRVYDVNKEEDLIDLGQKIFDKSAPKRVDTGGVRSGKPRLSGLPAAGYTLQTGFAGILIGNIAFYTSRSEDAKQSSILANLTYSQYKQILLPIQSNIWTKDNKYNISTDWRYLKFPSYTYGLGGHTNLSDGYTIDYSGLRLHQGILKELYRNIYLGVGFDFDYFWGIREVDPPANAKTDFQNYGLKEKEVGSGPTANFLIDTRKNSINPQNGVFFNVVYRPTFTWLGSDNEWQSLIVDARTYFKFPAYSDNVLAFWTYDWFTVNGTPPYLLLPNTGGDPYSNTGRGYIQSRLRGMNLVYGEAEYRFNIMRNELIGGVVFLNAESVTDKGTNKFTMVWPGYGAGLRFRLNKFSRTNIAIDYGFGAGGSQGFFVNLGEVF